MKTTDFINELKKNGCDFFTGVPCSIFSNLILSLEQEKNYIISNNEGESVSFAAGAYLNGKYPVMIMQNDGLGNAFNPITSLYKLYKMHGMLLISWRGCPNKKPDAIQHLWSGKTLLNVLEALDIEYEIFDKSDNQIGEKIEKLTKNSIETNNLCAVIVTNEFFTDDEKITPTVSKKGVPKSELLEYAMNKIGEKTEHKVFSTTGRITRDLAAIMHRKKNFYSFGSMGCTNAIALGDYMNDNERKIRVVFDGDGSLMMRYEHIFSISDKNPANFIYIVLDNGKYQTTGGQQTLARSHAFDMPSVIDSSGLYTRRIDHLDDFKKEFDRLFNQFYSGNDFDPFVLYVRCFEDKEIAARPSVSIDDIKNGFMEK